MNLETTISVWAGGPGSGCNPAAGRCGREAVNKEKKSGILWKDIIDPHFAKKEAAIFKRSKIEYKWVPHNLLQHQGSRMNDATTKKWYNRMKQGKEIPAIVVSNPLTKSNDPGAFGKHLILDGHHRSEATAYMFPYKTSKKLGETVYNSKLGMVRVAVLTPTSRAHDFVYEEKRRGPAFELTPQNRKVVESWGFKYKKVNGVPTGAQALRPETRLRYTKELQ